ncbi:uncharacterized protein LOC123293571 [Chrysoperla carnea]|uniref:uncharacterized protein LOC123293571 n=1 Tax=Chrysoperla carnea TaxID=189513 RepID=UPI001D07751C|nr:uncharacterized protein LOC123293571 [Chrysoperla carnea]
MQRNILFSLIFLIILISHQLFAEYQSFDEAFYESDLRPNEEEFYDESDLLSNQLAEPDFVLKMLRDVAGPMDENYDYHEDGTKTKKESNNDYDAYGGGESAVPDYGEINNNYNDIEKDAGPGPVDYSDQLNYY